MVGPSNSTNKFGPSNYVVGTPANGLGNGVNFTSIQAAYNQAVADGYGIGNPTTILIRPGQYSESLTITDGGIAFDCASNAISGGAVIVDGNLTLNVTGPNAFSFSNITFTSSLNPTVTITGAAVPFRGSFNNCSFSCSDPGTVCIDISVPSGTFGFANFRGCQIQSDGNGIYNNSRTIVIMENSDSQSAAGSAVVLDSSGRLQAEFSSLVSNAAYGVLFNAAANQCTIYNSNISSVLTAIEMTVGGTSNVFKSTISTSDASGFWVVGTGNLSYCDVINQGSAIGIDPGLGVISIPDWKPYAESGAAPGTGVIRGTAAFDSAAFSVTDGFVQLLGGGVAVTSLPTDSGTATPNILAQIAILGGPGVTTEASGPSSIQINSVTFTDVGGVTTVAANSGSFCSTVGSTAITLPAAPQEGDLCEFAISNGAGFIVTANAGQTLRLGNQTGTTATSTDLGDAVILRFRASISEWHAMSIIGNWTIA